MSNFCRYVLTPDSSSESHLTCYHAQIAAAGRCQLCPWHGQFQRETVSAQTGKFCWVLLTSPLEPGLQKVNPISSAGVEDEPVKCNKHFREQFPNAKYCYPKPMHKWEEPAGFLGGYKSRVWISYLFVFKVFWHFSLKMGQIPSGQIWTSENACFSTLRFRGALA